MCEEETPQTSIQEEIIKRVRKEQEKTQREFEEFLKDYDKKEWCTHLRVTPTSISRFQTIGLSCKQLSSHASCKQQSLSPKDVKTLCHKHCHNCPCYEQYVEPVIVPPEHYDISDDDDEYDKSEAIYDLRYADKNDIIALYKGVLTGTATKQQKWQFDYLAEKWSIFHRLNYLMVATLPQIYTENIPVYTLAEMQKELKPLLRNILKDEED